MRRTFSSKFPYFRNDRNSDNDFRRNQHGQNTSPYPVDNEYPLLDSNTDLHTRTTTSELNLKVPIQKADVGVTQSVTTERPRLEYARSDNNRDVDGVDCKEYSELFEYNYPGHKDESPVFDSDTMHYVHGAGLKFRHRDDEFKSETVLEEQHGYIDQQGDDYQIISYLDSYGEVVNPYGSFSTPFNKNRGVAGEEAVNSILESTVPQLSVTDVNRASITGLQAPSMRTTFEDSTSMTEDDEEHDLSSYQKSKKGSIVLRKFKLFRGNFIFDCPISAHLILQYSRDMNKAQLTNEYKFMRYQAVTCEPAEFLYKNFTLRQMEYKVPRRTELMVVITMYNENEVLLARTLKGVMDNIKHFTKRKRSSVWGPDAWKRICVCIVSDGRKAINGRALALLSALGCYQDGFAKDEINGKKVVAHIYEHTTKINISRITGSKVKLTCGERTVPVQLLFCLKERNQKKINSHRWAFEAFAQVLQPEIITLLDAGTMPGKDSIYHLWKEFNDPNIGGACGEIKADLGRNYFKLLNPLVASQNFEYKMSNILDKTTESNFGFISVLPGAFSAYRFAALRGEPLRKYFMGENLDSTVFVSNMYLAEDRILCFEIVTKKNARWLLRYCRASCGSTDVPERIPEFILQRRRWLNGSFFAALYSFVHFYKIWSSGHSFFRKLLLTVEFMYLFICMLSAWFSLSSFFLVFRILTLSITISYPDIAVFKILSVIFLWLYGVNILVTFILSLGNKPKGTPKFYIITFIFFAILMGYMLFCAIFMSVHSIITLIKQPHLDLQSLVINGTFRDLVISMASTYCLYVAASLIYLQPMHMVTSFIQYVLLSPSYINTLNIYAFCNVHDISWGTKGDIPKPLGKLNSKEDGTVRMEIPVSADEIEYNYMKHMKVLMHPDASKKNESLSFEDQKTSYLAMVRSMVIVVWIISNFIIIALVLETGGIGQYQIMKQNPNATSPGAIILSKNATFYFTLILWLVCFIAAVRFIGCCIYMLKRMTKRFTFKL